ncbi:hypothetical protein OUZ56_026077 [Daphnia magna]|uniref:Uncharacterized protein n=1 Tax=Daphnia magna TaxID=35525 RepID=A0ABQ9ZL80_9CRUS|nr:hypothetical protein OUZ56_026077 [Daphnia magna]
MDEIKLPNEWVASSQPDILEMLEELNIKTYPQFINGTKIMQVGHGNTNTQCVYLFPYSRRILSVSGPRPTVKLGQKPLGALHAAMGFFVTKPYQNIT